MNGKASPTVDNTDWLKTVAIVLVAVDHFGYFFVADADWWSVFGRLAAPPFFFLLGYAQTRRVPLHWIWLAFLLTLLDSWNAGWSWVAPNILLGFALIRLARPHVQTLLLNHGWAAFVIIVAALIVALPMASEIVDYGAEGWLWALVGLLQRMYLDQRTTEEPAGTATAAMWHPPSVIGGAGLMRMLACLAAAFVYIWQEQVEFSFSPPQFVVFVIGVFVLSLGLYLFRRGPSRLQPPEFLAGTLHFIGRHTLEIYAIQLAGSELLVLLVPGLAA